MELTSLGLSKVVVLGIVLVLLADRCWAQDTPGHTVGIILVDSATGKGISRAKVSLAGLTLPTDSRGRIVFANVREGIYSLEVRPLKDYLTFLWSVTVAKEDIKQIVFKLDKVK